MAALTTLDSASVLLTTFALLCAVYTVFSPLFKTPRQSAWILSTVASGTMTAASLPFVRDYLVGGVDNIDERAGFAIGVNRVFQAYLAADLVVGSIFYSSQINLLTGWVHHLVYLGICEFAIRAGWAYIFGLCAIMELPTFLLGLGTLLPRLRSDNLFGVLFFLTRIALHLVLIFTYCLSTHRPHGSIAPALILSSVFPLHAMWFLGCVKGFVRRANKRKLARLAATNHPLAPDVHLDARSLSHHASTAAVVPAWDLTLRLHRIRARVDRWAVNWVRVGRVGRWASLRRPIRPRAMARRMSESLVGVLPSKEAMMEFVGLGGVI
ncbi:hypothetical protein C8F01DRAFT_1235389 [Mycena amicta]|nr:hypothetical protein C8F01DRAFT_1235389 [Mycena amicta]